MAYVEFLRARRAFYIFAIVVAALVGFALLSLFTSHGGSRGGNSFRLGFGYAIIFHKGADGRITETPVSDIPDVAIPLGVLFGIAAYCAAIFATILSTSLNRERDGLDFPLTRPVSRERIALSYFGVDLLAIAAVFTFTLIVLCLVPLATAGLLGRITVTPQSWWILVLGLGVSFMWYGLVQAVTARLRVGGGWIAGGSWALFSVLLLLPGATFLGPIVHFAVVVLNFINPLAYFHSVGIGDDRDVTIHSLYGLGLAARSGIVWAIGVVACTIALQSWKRIEV
jgi:hypothetical protein